MTAKFRPPKECPVYHPTEDEFADPMKYIARIEPEAREYGICRIVPPPSFKPPFAADFDAFKFAPRIQLLHTLDGIARLRFSFNQSLRKFWQIFTPDYDWVIPEINGKIVDYFELHKAVESLGGYDAACSKARWVEVARKCDVISASAAAQLQQQNGTANGKKRGSGAQHTDEKATLDQWARYLKGEYDATVRPFFLLMRHVDPECLYIFGHRGSSGSNSNKRPLSSYYNNSNNKRPAPPSRMNSGGPSRMQSRMQSRTRSSSNITAASEAGNSETTSANGSAETNGVAKGENMTDAESTDADFQPTNTAVGRGSKRSSSDSRFAAQQTPESLVPANDTTSAGRMKTRSNSSGNALTIGKSSRPADEDDDLLPVAGRLKRNRRTLSAVSQQSSYAEPTICAVCFALKDEDLDELRQCDKCELFFHENCLGVGADDYPKNCAWYCLNCLRDKLAEMENTDAVGTDIRNYGFEITKREYTLSEFNHIADTFKAKYFGTTTPNEIPQPQVEQEFWKLMQWQNPCEMIYMCVLYGADLRREMGSSGFPIQDDMDKLSSPADRQYVQHPWNLNNLPLQPGSVLKHIPGNISGMKVPWKYAGACFSAFCWHNEDHWTYSINYNHLGEPKTWYGVPGHAADKFEEAFRKICPELLRANSDLLHQITTHLNPNLLQRHGVPVYRTDQRAGNFIITFPRAYHAGFNHGFNFAEAVNFCLASWIEWGRRAVDNYSRYKRLNVFAHDEMIVHCALNNPAYMNLGIKKAVYNDLCLMARRIQQVEASIGSLIPYRERVFFEHVPDEERQCDECCTTCFLVGIVCGCMQQPLASVPAVPGQMTLSARNSNSTSNLAAGMRSGSNGGSGAQQKNSMAEAATGTGTGGGGQAPPGQPAPAGGGMMRNRMMSHHSSMRHHHHHHFQHQNSEPADFLSVTSSAVAVPNSGANVGVMSGEPRFACPQHACTKCTHEQMVYKYRCSFDELKQIAQRVRTLILQEDPGFTSVEHDDFVYGREPPPSQTLAEPEQVLLNEQHAGIEPKNEAEVLCCSEADQKVDEKPPAVLIVEKKEENVEPISNMPAGTKERVFHFPKHATVKKPAAQSAAQPSVAAAAVLPTLTPTSSVAYELSALTVGLQGNKTQSKSNSSSTSNSPMSPPAVTPPVPTTTTQTTVPECAPNKNFHKQQQNYYALSPPPSLASPDFAALVTSGNCILPANAADSIGPMTTIMRATKKEPVLFVQQQQHVAAVAVPASSSATGRNMVDRSV